MANNTTQLFNAPAQTPLFGPQPQRRDPRLDLAELMIAEGSSTAPVKSPMEGFARMLQAGIGGITRKQAYIDEQKERQTRSKLLAEALMGGAPSLAQTADATGQAGPTNANAAMMAEQQAKQQRLADALSSGVMPESVAQDAYARQMFPDLYGKEQKPISVSPGGTILDPVTMQPVYQAPFAPEKEAAPPAGFTRSPDGGLQVDPSWLDTQLKLRAAGRQQTTVNVGPTGIDYGDPPKDMAWARDPDGKVMLEADDQSRLRPVAVPIAGGPMEQEQAAAQAAAEAGQAQQKVYADIVTEDIDRVTGKINEASFPTTGMGSLTSAVPGTPAHDISKLLDTIRSNVGFDRLQQMRDASPTGGALGQVSENENRLLQATIGSLEQSQSKEQLLYNLQRVKDTYLDVIHGPGNRPGAAQEQEGGDFGAMDDAAFLDVDIGTLAPAQKKAYNAEMSKRGY